MNSGRQRDGAGSSTIHHSLFTIHSPREGFTLVEMIAVFAIIIFLVSLIIGVSKYANRAAKENTARSDIQQISNILQDYFVNQGRYPASLAAVGNRLKDTFSRYSGGDLLDPWQNPYHYVTNSAYSYTLLSRGADGQMGSTAADADNICVSGK